MPAVRETGIAKNRFSAAREDRAAESLFTEKNIFGAPKGLLYFGNGFGIMRANRRRKRLRSRKNE